MAMVINKVFVHHSGGLGLDRLASTRFLTVERIEKYHLRNWDDVGELGSPAGYNFIYDPKTRLIVQTRLLGEQTIAQKGYNDTGASLCVIGNYNAKNGRPIDPVTSHIENDVGDFLEKLVYNPHQYKTKAGTTFSLSPAKIAPHRAVSPTDCNGAFLSDTWARDLVINRITTRIYRQIQIIWAMILDMQMKGATLGGMYERECSGSIELVD